MNQIEARAADILLSLGVPMHLDGFHYLRSAAAHYAEFGNRPVRMMIDIYAKVAEEFGTNARCVEHSIRTAIDKVFREGDMDTLASFFGRSISTSSGKVTSQTFIAIVAHHAVDGAKSNFG